MRGMGLACFLGWTVVGSAQIPGYTISPTNIQLSSLLTQQSVVIVPPSSSTPFQFQTTVTTSTGGAWMVTIPQSAGPVVGAQAFTIVANLAGLIAGVTYTGNVRVTIGGQTQDISVTLFMASPSPVTSFTLSPSILNLSANQSTQAVNIMPSGTAAYQYTATTITTSGGTWLSVNPASGTGSGMTTFTVLANPAGLAQGFHTGVVRVTVNNWIQDLPVTLTVGSNGGGSLQVTPTALNFEYTRGEAPPPSQAVQLISSTAMIFMGSIENATADFVRVSVVAGTTYPGLSIDIIVQPPPWITPGTHTAEVKFRSPGLPTVTVHVTLVVKGPPPPCTSMPLSVSLHDGQMQSSVRISTGTSEPKLYSLQIPASWLWTNDPGGTIVGSKDIVVQAVRQPGMQAGATYTSGVHIVMPEGSCLVPISYTTPALWPLAILSSSMPGGMVGVAYNSALVAEGGGKPYTWSQTGLPDGLTLDAATGVVRGTPTKADAFVAKITVRDSIGGTATADFPIAVQQGDPQKLSFVPMTPCRVMETRAQYNFEGRGGAFGPPFLNGMETRTLTLPASNVCSIPATAQAFVLNVTAIPRGMLDYVAVYAGDESQPQLRTVSSPDGQVVANSALVRAGNGGTIKVFASHNTDLLIDISGYFSVPGTNPGLTYYPVSPCRAVETRAEYRTGTGLFGPPGLNAGETRRFRLPDSPWCSLPQGAAAYSATITVIPKGPLPFLTMWPSGTGQPNVSSINSFAGRVLANSVIVPAGADGSIDVFAFDRTDLLIDINGYFAPDDGVKGLYFTPGVPCRITGPRQLAVGNETALSLLTASPCTSVSSTAKAYAFHVTAMPAGSPMPFLTLYPAGEPRPNASVLNAFEGQTVTNSVIVPVGGSGGVAIYAYRATNVIVERVGYFRR